MKKMIIAVTICSLVMASSAFAADIIGRHDLSNDRGIVRVRSVEGSKMALDVIYAPRNGTVVVLTGIFADYNPQAQKAVYSEDRFCPDALKLTFQNNGKVVLHQAACAAF